jgi:hypothetical protein
VPCGVAPVDGSVEFLRRVHKWNLIEGMNTTASALPNPAQRRTMERHCQRLCEQLRDIRRAQHTKEDR